MKKRKLCAVIVLAVALSIVAMPAAAADNSHYKQLVEAYRLAVESGDQARISAALRKLNASKAAVKYMEHNAPKLAAHYRRQSSHPSWTEINKRARGEVAVRTGPVFVKDPELAHLADPANRHLPQNNTLPPLKTITKVSKKRNERRQQSAGAGTQHLEQVPAVEPRRGSGTKVVPPVSGSGIQRQPGPKRSAAVGGSPGAHSPGDNAIARAIEEQRQKRLNSPVVDPKKAGIKMPERGPTYDPNRHMSPAEVNKIRREAAWHEAQQNAASKVSKFQQSLKDDFGPKQQMDTARRIQGDTLAVDQINRGDPNLRREYNKVTEKIQKDQAENLKNKIAERYHGNTSDVKVSTMSTQKPKPPAVPLAGHDEDVGASFRGREIPVKTLEKDLAAARGSAVNEKLKPRDLARENVVAAGYDAPDGLGAHPGEARDLLKHPETRSKDPHGYAEQWGRKATEPMENAHRARAAGDMPGAELQDFEGKRQLSKMGGETGKRVKAHGGQMSQHLKNSLEIVDQAGKPGADGRLTSPAEVDQKLRDRGETVGSLRNKLEANNAGVEILKEPGTGVPDKVRMGKFNQTVQDKVYLNRRESGSVPRDPNRPMEKPPLEPSGQKTLTKGRASVKQEVNPLSAAEQALTSTLIAGQTAKSGTDAMGRAIDENRDLNASDAQKVATDTGKAVLWEATLTGEVAKGSYEIGNKHGREEALKYQKGEKDLSSALGDAVAATGKDFVDRAAETAEQGGHAIFDDAIKNNIDKMEKTAEKEGRDATMWEGLQAYGGTLYDATKEVAKKGGELVSEGVEKIGEAYYDSTTYEARGELAGQKHYMEQFVDQHLTESQRNIKNIQDNLEALIWNGDPNDPGIRQQKEELLAAYEIERSKLNDLHAWAQKNIGQFDSDRVSGLEKELDQLVDPHTLQDYALNTNIAPPSDKQPPSDGADGTDKSLNGGTDGDSSYVKDTDKQNEGNPESPPDETDGTDKSPTDKSPTDGTDKSPDDGSQGGQANLNDPDSQNTVDGSGQDSQSQKAADLTAELINYIQNSDKSPEDAAREFLSQLRNSEINTGQQDGDGSGYDATQKYNVTDSAARDYDNAHTNTDTRNIQLALAEREDASQAHNDAQRADIDWQAQSVEQNISSTKNQHASAESATQVQRQQSTQFADAIVGGLTSGVAAGVDAAAGNIGAAAGNVVSDKIEPEENSSSGSGTTGQSNQYHDSHTTASSGSSAGSGATGQSNPQHDSHSTGASPFQGTLTGSWGGNHPNWGKVGGSFSIQISAGGRVTGSYSGLFAHGPLSGSVANSGNVNIRSGGGSTGNGGSWQGTIGRTSTGALWGSGSWSAEGASGSWSGGGGG